MSKAALTVVSSNYVSTPEEKRLLATRKATKAAYELPAVSFKIQDGGKSATIEFDHPDHAVAVAIYSAALKTVTVKELYGILTELSYFAQKPDGSISESKFNAAVQTVANMRPHDIAETMLCTQMVAIHQSTMTYVSSLMVARVSPSKATRISSRDFFSSGESKAILDAGYLASAESAKE